MATDVLNIRQIFSLYVSAYIHIFIYREKKIEMLESAYTDTHIYRDEEI